MRKWFGRFDEEDVQFVGFAAAMLLAFIAFVVIWYLHFYQA